MEDRTTGQAECENENLTESEIDKYFSEDQTGCPYKEVIE
jgi:hypothetical protein